MGDSTRVSVTVFPRTDLQEFNNAASLVPPYDPASQFPWFIQDCGRYWSDKSLYWDGEKRPVQGGNGEDAVFDPSFQDWIQETVRSTSPRRYQRLELAQPIEFLSTVLAFQHWPIDSVRPAKSSHRPDTNVDNAWIGKTVDDILARQDWHTDTVSTKSSRKYQRDTNIDTGWIQQALPLVFDPAQQDWHQDTTVTAHGKKPIPDTNIQLSWIDAAINPSTNPALAGWQVDSQRTKFGKPVKSDVPDLGWINTVTAPAGFDPSTFWWGLTDNERRFTDRSLYQDGEKRPVQGGVGVAPPAYDPTQLSWFIDSGLPLRRKKPTQWLDALPFKEAFGLLDSRVTEPAYEQLWFGFRSRTNLRYRQATSPLDGWGYVNLPVPFDASLLPHWSDDRMARQHKPPFQNDQPEQGWINSAQFDPQYSPQSFDVRLNKRYKNTPALDQPLQDWITFNTPVQFDASLLPHWQDERMAKSRNRQFQLDQPFQDWLTVNLPVQFDASLFPIVQDQRMVKSRNRPFPLDQPGQDWLNSAQFNSQYLPHSVDERLRERYHKVPRLDQQQDGWLNAAQFQAQYVVHSDDGRARDRFTPVHRLRMAYYQYDYDMPWLRDVLGLPDQVVTDHLLTCTGCGT